jgi:hypothetical protein
MNKSFERSSLSPRQVGAVTMSADDVSDYAALGDLGISFGAQNIKAMANYAMDATNQADVSAPSITTPVQFLQN